MYPVLAKSIMLLMLKAQFFYLSRFLDEDYFVGDLLSIFCYGFLLGFWLLGSRMSPLNWLLLLCILCAHGLL